MHSETVAITYHLPIRLDPVTLRPAAIGPELREACRQLMAPDAACAPAAA